MLLHKYKFQQISDMNFTDVYHIIMKQLHTTQKYTVTYFQLQIVE